MIEIAKEKITCLNTEQMIEVDRAMIEDYQIELIQMMENAGRNLAHLARNKFLNANPSGKNILVMAGSGGNGGGVLVAARRLSNWGASVTVALAQEPEKMTSIPAHQLDILRRMKIENTEKATTTDALKGQAYDLILDGLIGYSLKGAPYGLVADLICMANDCNAAVLSLDTPSGIDTTSGTIYKPAIKANATLTLALPKVGLFAQGVPEYTGELFLADISVPPELYSSPSLSLQVGAIFSESDIVKII
jgi:NAD(P)H-hydrate epimerase